MTKVNQSNQKPTGQKPPSKGSKKEGFPGPFFLWVLAFVSLFYILRLSAGSVEPGSQALTYSEFFGALSAEDSAVQVSTAIRAGNQIKGEFINELCSLL